jgi:hypothetical protein
VRGGLKTLPPLMFLLLQLLLLRIKIWKRTKKKRRI